MLGVAPFGLVVRDPAEELFGPRSLARSLIQVGEGIGASQVMFHWSLRTFPTLAEEPNRRCHLALIGERPGSHDAAFSHELRCGRRLTQLSPECVNIGIVAYRPVGVGKHGILVRQPRKMSHLFKDFNRIVPLTKAIQGQSPDLGDFDHLGHQLVQPVGNGLRFAHPTGVDMVGCLVQVSPRTRTGGLAEQVDEMAFRVGKFARSEPRPGTGETCTSVGVW